MTKRTLTHILQSGAAVMPRDTVSLLPPRTTKAKKQRVYKTRTVSFYLHPRLAERSAHIRALIEEIAERESVSMDQTKFTFVDFGRHCYEQDDIHLAARPNPSVRKLTVEWEESDVWKREIGHKRIQKPPVEKRKYSIAFRGVTDDQSLAMKKEVKTIADKHAVTPGEIVLILLEHAVNQYSDGKLSLKKSQFSVENKVDGWGEKT